MSLLSLISIIMLAPAFIVCVYYVVLALNALFKRANRMEQQRDPHHKFAIVIPAHNEEISLGDTLKSCRELDYPKDKYTVFVIADNCTDRTSEVAIENGAVCLARFDEEQKGKGFALEWAFDRLTNDGHDAFVILDADCTIDSNALRVFDQYLCDGNLVLQANYAVSNPDENTISYVLAVGNFIENELFYAPKSRLGLAVLLRGTGMAIHSSVLKEHAWKACSLTEDLEYTIELFRSGIRPKFIQEVRVWSPFPVEKTQLKVQRERWAGGTFRSGKSHAFEFIWEGLLKGQPILVDAGWTMLVLSRPMVLAELFIAFGMAVLCFFVASDALAGVLLAVAASLVVLQMLYFTLGIVLFGLNVRRTSFLLNSPMIIGRLVWISVMALFGAYSKTWAKTPR